MGPLPTSAPKNGCKDPTLCQVCAHGTPHTPDQPIPSSVSGSTGDRSGKRLLAGVIKNRYASEAQSAVTRMAIAGLLLHCGVDAQGSLCARKKPYMGPAESTGDSFRMHFSLAPDYVKQVRQPQTQARAQEAVCCADDSRSCYQKTPQATAAAAHNTRSPLFVAGR